LLWTSASDGVYLYALDPRAGTLRLTGSAGAAPESPLGTWINTAAPGLRWVLQLQVAFAVERAAFGDQRLACFPEFAEFGFAGAVSIPLLASGRLAGVLNLCRFRERSYASEELSSALGLAGPLAVHLAQHSQAGTRLPLRRDSAERRVVDWAKRLLQQRHACTEEVAYYALRRTSRRSRQTITDVARIVLKHGGLPESKFAFPIETRSTR